MPGPENAATIAQTALDQLLEEGELDSSWSVTAEFSLPNQTHQAIFRRLDPDTHVETAETSVDFDPAADDAVESIKNHIYEWVEMSGGR